MRPQNQKGLALNTVDRFTALRTTEQFASLPEYLAARERIGTDLAQRTRDEYARRIAKVRTKLARAGIAMTPETLLAEYQAQVSELRISKSTARAFRGACYFWLGEEAQALQDRGESYPAYVAAFAAIAQLSIARLPAKTDRSSSLRPKEFPQEALRLIEAYAAKRPRAEVAHQLVTFLRANLLLGMRPDEWFGASGPAVRFQVAPDGRYQTTATGELRFIPSMVIENAKTSHGRSNGESRELFLYGLTDAQFRSIEDCWRMIGARQEAIPGAAKGQVVQKFLQVLNRALKRILTSQGYKGQALTVYCTRHQAVANAKASGMTDKEVAGLFGHGSTQTARRHYGRKLKAWGRTSFRPSPESLANVRGIGSSAGVAPEVATPPTEPWIASLGDRVIDRPE